MKRLSRIKIALATCLIVLAARQVGASAITFDEKNLSILNEVVVTTNSMLIQEFGPSVGSILNLTGTFTANGWNANLGGVYGGMAVAFTFTGLFDQSLDSGNFTSTGTIGNSSWLASGLWSFADIDVNNVSLAMSSEATITPPVGEPMKPDRKWGEKVLTKNPDGSTSDNGDIFLSENGTFNGKTEKEKSTLPPNPSGSER